MEGAVTRWREFQTCGPAASVATALCRCLGASLARYASKHRQRSGCSQIRAFYGDRAPSLQLLRRQSAVACIFSGGLALTLLLRVDGRRESEADGVIGAEAGLELLLQGGFGFGGEAALSGFFAREFGQDGEFFLQLGGGDAVPEAVFKFEHVDFLLLDGEDFGVRQLDHDLVFADVDGEIFF